MDTSISIWLSQLAQHTGLRQAAEVGAKYLVAVPALIVAWLLVRTIIRRDAAALASLVVAGAGTAVALLVNMAATSWWYRARPYTALADVHALVTPNPESSFFSDHTIAATGLAIAALLVSRRWGLAAAGAAVLVAVARVAVGAHYPTDVLTAIVVTTAAIAAFLPARPSLERLTQRGLERLPTPLSTRATSASVS